MTPKRTLELLDDLQALGFDDRTFWRLHHFRQRGRRETIASHRIYCEVHPGEFELEGNNPRVQSRLEFVLRSYREWNLPHGNTTVFDALAEAAFLGIPPIP